MRQFTNFHQLKREANTNFNDYKKAQTIYNTIKDKDKLYSNLQYANGVITSMLEDNDIIHNDLNHQILAKSFDNMTNIYTKGNLSTLDIDSFYTSLEGIIDVNRKLRGEGK